MRQGVAVIHPPDKTSWVAPRRADELVTPDSGNNVNCPTVILHRLNYLLAFRFEAPASEVKPPIVSIFSRGRRVPRRHTEIRSRCAGHLSPGRGGLPPCRSQADHPRTHLLSSRSCCRGE